MLYKTAVQWSPASPVVPSWSTGPRKSSVPSHRRVRVGFKPGGNCMYTLPAALTEGAFEEVIATLGHVDVETRVGMLQHHLVPPLLRRRRTVRLHFLHRLRLKMKIKPKPATTTTTTTCTDGMDDTPQLSAWSLEENHAEDGRQVFQGYSAIRKV